MIVSEYTIPGLHVRDHVVTVPLDWSKPEGRTIEFFAREVVDPARKDEALPLLCFLQGGPGGKSPRPTKSSPSWLAKALKTHRIILPDQRGTGRSTPVDAATIAGFDGEAGADYLACFRADSVVDDLEHFRKTTFNGERWQTLGQSYGGFLTLTYLSRAPEGLSACYVAGGVPSLDPSADEVYRHTYPRVRAKNEIFYKRYPDDKALVARIADFIDANPVMLPDGDRLSVRRFQSLGLDFGMGPGFENIHWLLDEAFAAPDRLSDQFLGSVMQATAYHGNPLFAVIHEAIYGQGEGATAWSAERLLAEFPEFDAKARPLLFTGEMIYPSMFEEVALLKPFRAAAEALAHRPRHSRLYDKTRLAENTVPLAAVVYHDDMYVDAGISLQTASAVGNMDVWITNEFEHDGIRQSGAVFDRLVAMVAEKGGPLKTGR